MQVSTKYDTQLFSYARTAIQAQIAALHKFEAEFVAFDPRGLSPFVASDRELVLARIRARLLDLESIRQWEKNPDIYSSGVTHAVFVILSRSFAPPADRLKSVIARERLIPRVLKSARENLTNPPRIYTEVALEQLPGIIGFFQSDVPAAFNQVTDAALIAEFRETNQTVIEELKAYQDWLEQDLLARSRGDFRIGAGNYRKKLLYSGNSRYTARSTARNRLSGPPAQPGMVQAGCRTDRSSSYSAADSRGCRKRPSPAGQTARHLRQLA